MPVNRILYGPPGTGKTWKLREQLQPRYVSEEAPDPFQWLVQQVEDATWFDVIFAALFDIGRAARVTEIAEHPFIEAKAKAQGRVEHIRNTLWSTLQKHAIPESHTVKLPESKRYPPLVFDKLGNSEWELAGDWKEECESQMELARLWKAGPEAGTNEKRFIFVTFHQAYSYEDFVEGIRPVQDEESGEVVYRVLPGVFRRICRRAQDDPSHRYAIFIDEINRGNIAKIFGETHHPDRGGQAGAV